MSYVYVRIKKQNDYKDCGLCVIESLHNHYFGKSLELDELRKSSKITEKGLSIQALIELGAEYGVIIDAFNAPFESVIQNEKEIMVTLIESEGNGHFIIFQKQNDKYIVWDPAKGKYILEVKEFEKIYKGVVLTVAKGTFQKQNNEDTKMFKLLIKSPSIFSWIVVSMLIGIIFSFTSTLFMKITLDKVLPGHLTLTLNILAIGFGLMAILRVLNITLRKYLTRKIELSLEYEILQLFVTKMQDAPLSELNKYSKSDILRRISIIEHISIFIASGAFLLINEAIVFIVSATLLLWISPTLFAITFAAGAISVGVSVGFHFFINSEYESLPNKQMISMEKRWDLISSLSDLKNPKYSSFLANNLDKSFIEFKGKESKVWNASNIQSIFLEIIHFVMPIFMTYVSVNLIFDKSLSVGTMMMFLGVFATFISPLLQLCDFFVKFKQNMKNYKLVESFINLKSEIDNPKGIAASGIKKIKFENYKFAIDKEILNIKTFEINESLRLKGKNGAGKSTLLKSLALRNNWSNIFINNIEADYYSINTLRDKIFITSPESELVSETIFDQVTMKSRKSIQKLEENISQHGMRNVLESVGINLNTRIINGGDNLSSGQKQLVKLLRLFAFDYDVILLDEAFENIDENVFQKLKEILPIIHANSIFVEVSHSNRFIFDSKEVEIEEINFR